jgi:membrane associated rhomboid family serine protease
MIPLKDNVPTRTVPIITITLILVNIFIFLWYFTLPEALERSVILRYALVPKELVTSLTSRPELLPYNCLTIVTSMFLHGGILHVGGNMLYLWIFGNNIEDAVGHFRSLLFYLLSGVAAALVQVSFDPASSVPMIGASGAVSGVLGAYLLLYPRARVKTLIFIFVFITTAEIPAVVLLSVWFFFQVAFSHGGGVAWFAHIGGFLFGLMTIKIFTAGIRPVRRGVP